MSVGSVRWTELQEALRPMGAGAGGIAGTLSLRRTYWNPYERRYEDRGEIAHWRIVIPVQTPETADQLPSAVTGSAFDELMSREGSAGLTVDETTRSGSVCIYADSDTLDRVLEQSRIDVFAVDVEVLRDGSRVATGTYLVRRAREEFETAGLGPTAGDGLEPQRLSQADDAFFAPDPGSSVWTVRVRDDSALALRDLDAALRWAGALELRVRGCERVFAVLDSEGRPVGTDRERIRFPAVRGAVNP